MFCIKCGAEAVVENFCEKCFLEKERLFDVGGFTVFYCRGCDTYTPTIKDAVMKSVKTKNIIKSCRISTSRVGNKLRTVVTCTGYIKPFRKLVREEKNIDIIIRNHKCENCIRVSGGYYEAVLQARGPKTERIVNKIIKSARRDEISNIVRLKEGVDVRFVSKKKAAPLVKFLREFFDVKESYKLAGEKNGKKLYRNYYAIR